MISYPTTLIRYHHIVPHHSNTLPWYRTPPLYYVAMISYPTTLLRCYDIVPHHSITLPWYHTLQCTFLLRSFVAYTLCNPRQNDNIRDLTWLASGGVTICWRDFRLVHWRMLRQVLTSKASVRHGSPCTTERHCHLRLTVYYVATVINCLLFVKLNCWRRFNSLKSTYSGHRAKTNIFNILWTTRSGVFTSKSLCSEIMSLAKHPSAAPTPFSSARKLLI